MYLYEQAEQLFSRQEFYRRNSYNDMLVDYYEDCNCLPACTSITYEAELTQAAFDTINLKKTYTGFDTDSHNGWVKLRF